MLETLPAPADIPAPTSYHWSPALQADFLGHLAATGSVKHAARQVGMSPRAAYDLRHRADGMAFRLGWAAAVLIARARLEDELLDRAVFGVEESYQRIPIGDGAHRIERRRTSVQISFAMLARLDRIVAERAVTPEARVARLITGDWSGFLALFAAPDFADAALTLLKDWIAGRRDAADPIAALLAPPAIPNEVAQISAPLAPEPTEAEKTADFAASLSIWHDAEADEWRTDFPPSPDFLGEENGHFGHADYWRNLDDAEQEIVDAWEEEDIAPLRLVAEARRRDFFDFESVI